MFLPIGDSPNPKHYFPYVTWLIIGGNVAIFFLLNVPLQDQPVGTSHPLLEQYLRMLLDQGVPREHLSGILGHLSANDLLLYTYGFKPAAPSLLTLFTSLFLHSSFMHLFGNMLFLYIYGDNVEHQLGRVRFLVMYLVTGVVATLSFAFLAGHSMTPLVGASGAISGVLGCYFLMFPKNVVKVFILFFPFFMNVVRIPARIVLGIYLVIDNLLPVILQAGGNVAYGAHLGGFVAGLFIAYLGERFNWRLPAMHDADNQMSSSQPDKPFSDFPEKGSVAPGLREAVAQQNVGKLVSLTGQISTRELVSCDGQLLLDMVQLLKRGGALEYATKVVKAAISAQRNSQLLAEFYYEFGDIRLRQGFSTSAYQHLLTALDLVPAKETEGRIRRLLQTIEG